uniref:Reverse transcriptase Ty1/copia-type domain-containing protein n=1 Tax=Salix viminalis TaxID=40686 RepID=A0A6N2N1K4_SALVM
MTLDVAGGAAGIGSLSRQAQPTSGTGWPGQIKDLFSANGIRRDGRDKDLLTLANDTRRDGRECHTHETSKEPVTWELAFAKNRVDEYFHIDANIIILLVYVDDIIITGSDSNAIHKVIRSLTTEFKIKDLGDLHYFFGIQISHTHIGLFMSQSKYIQDLLLKTCFLSRPMQLLVFLIRDYWRMMVYRQSILVSKHCWSLVVPHIHKTRHCLFCSSSVPVYATSYDRSFYYSQKNSSLSQEHSTLRIYYHKGSLDLTTFSDADWAGDPNDKRSNTSLVIFLGSNPTSWSSKK